MICSNALLETLALIKEQSMCQLEKTYIDKICNYLKYSRKFKFYKIFPLYPAVPL